MCIEGFESEWVVVDVRFLGMSGNGGLDRSPEYCEHSVSPGLPPGASLGIVCLCGGLHMARAVCDLTLPTTFCGKSCVDSDE